MTNTAKKVMMVLDVITLIAGILTLVMNIFAIGGMPLWIPMLLICISQLFTIRLRVINKKEV